MKYLIYFIVTTFFNYLISLIISMLIQYGFEIISISVMLAFNTMVLLYLIDKKIEIKNNN